MCNASEKLSRPTELQTISDQPSSNSSFKLSSQSPSKQVRNKGNAKQFKLGQSGYVPGQGRTQMLEQQRQSKCRSLLMMAAPAFQGVYNAANSVKKAIDQRIEAERND